MDNKLPSAKPVKGTLVLIGGAEDRRDGKCILKRTVEIRHSRHVVIIPSASSYPSGLAEDYFFAFRALGVERVSTLQIRNREDAQRDDYMDLLREADLIFFTGGDPVKLVHILGDTRLMDEISKKFGTGTTLAGTSAGAAAASDPLLCDGDEQGLTKGSNNIQRGFGFVRDITIDTHFVNRGRIGRLARFLSTGQSQRGIGIGEDTAIVLAPDHTFEVIGSEMVTVISTEKVDFSNYSQIAADQPIAIDGIRVGFLPPGTIFNTQTWSIVSAPAGKQLQPCADQPDHKR